jgi:acyl-[acyl-carrier-protein] desaturase
MTERSKREVILALSDGIGALVERHLKRHDAWTPSQFVLEGDEDFTPEIRAEAFAHIARAAQNIDKALIAVLVLNLETESGLPWFHFLLSKYLGNLSPLASWASIWTAEEDRHAQALDRFLLLSGTVKMRQVELMRSKYIRAGFNPAWDGAYDLLAYTVFQEAATTLSYQNLRHALKENEYLEGTLCAILADEAKHKSFYREVFRLILGADPDRALIALWGAAKDFKMPGATMPHFEALAYISARRRIFGPSEFSSVVIEATTALQIERVKASTDEARRAQAWLLSYPRVLDRAAHRIKYEIDRQFVLPFLDEPITI